MDDEYNMSYSNQPIVMLFLTQSPGATGPMGGLALPVKSSSSPLAATGKTTGKSRVYHPTDMLNLSERCLKL